VKVSKEVGVSRRDSVTLKQSWETTLGGAAVLAQIKATMEESLATSISWEERESIETECKFVAPKCGRRTELVYQLQRDYAFNFQKPGWFGLKSWSYNLQEKTNRHHYKPLIEDPVEDCNCPEPAQPHLEGIPITITFDHVSMGASAVKASPANPTAMGFRAADQYWESLIFAPERNTPHRIEIAARQLPSVVRFLGDFDVESELYAQGNEEVARELTYVGILTPDFTAGLSRLQTELAFDTAIGEHLRITEPSLRSHKLVPPAKRLQRSRPLGSSH
jgi:hypothetical protein